VTVDDLETVTQRSSTVSLFALWLTSGILALWIVAGLFEALIGHPLVLFSYRAFGLISPLVGLVCLMLSLGALLDARQRRAPIRHAVVAAFVSVVIGVVPFMALPYDPS
jgi:hypothetical protein